MIDFSFKRIGLVPDEPSNQMVNLDVSAIRLPEQLNVSLCRTMVSFQLVRNT